MTNGEYQLVQLREDAMRHFREFDRFRSGSKYKPVIKALAATIDAADTALRIEREKAATA